MKTFPSFTVVCQQLLLLCSLSLSPSLACALYAYTRLNITSCYLGSSGTTPTCQKKWTSRQSRPQSCGCILTALLHCSSVQWPPHRCSLHTVKASLSFHYNNIYLLLGLQHLQARTAHFTDNHYFTLHFEGCKLKEKHIQHTNI